MNDKIQIKDLEEAIPTNNDWLVFQSDDDDKTYKAPKSEIEGEDAFVYIAYASDDIGTDFTLTFDSNLDYIAILSTDTEIPSPVVGDFVGLWKKYKGEKGDIGLTGAYILRTVGIPDNSLGNDGDWAFDTSSNSNVYYKSSGSWELVNSNKGAKGDTGNGIVSVIKTQTVGLVDTYTITYDDLTTDTFDVTNGAPGVQGNAGISVMSIIKTETVGLVDTYTITYSNATTSTFEVTNGDNGTDGISFIWRDNYNALTEYVINDVVYYNGSSYICIFDSVGNLPTNIAFWNLFASKGADGEGSGDVIGPDGATDSNFAAFDTLTGKLIKDSGYNASSFAPSSIFQYTDEMAQDAVGNSVGYGLDYDDATGAISVDESELTGIQASLDGKKEFHGVESIGAVTFDNGTHILSVASITYWYQGVKYTTASPITCDIDSFETLTANTLYEFYFNDASGTLIAEANGGFNLKTQVPVALVMWNGSAGAIMKEWHSHTRDLDWHINAHLTIGARYYSGLDLVTPSIATDNALSITGGTIYDEDLANSISNPQTTMRGWYQVSAGVYTYADYSLPYLGTSGQPQYLDTDTYTLTNVGANDFVCMWVYGSNDIDRPIYIIPTQANAAYNIISSARAEQPPSLAGLNISPEMKLLYKFIYKGDGQFQESVDYRQSSSLPAGGTAATSASAVSFVPTGNVAAIDVQSAIAELDTEKLALAGGTMTGKTIKAGTTEVGKTYTPGSGSQTVAIDASLNNMHIVTGNAGGTAITFTITGMTESQPIIISILQGSVVSTIAAWFATIRWAGGTAPTLTATVGKRDTFGFIRTGANTYDGFIIGQNC